MPPYAAFLFSKMGFEPHAEQARILMSPKRFVLVAGGDRSGKSILGAKYLEKRYFEAGEGKRLYWLVAVDYEKTRVEFETLLQDFAKMGLLKRATKRLDPGQIELLDGTKIKTKSAKDPQALVMEAPDGIVACEATLLDLESYKRLDVRTAEKRGWLYLSGSFESALGWYASLWKSWAQGYGDAQSFSLPTWSNLHLFPGGRQDPEILRMERESSEEWFLQRLGGVPSPPKGLVLPEFRPDLHIRPVEWLGESEVVYIWEDPGYGTTSAHAVEVAQITKEGQVQVFWESYTQGLITSEVIEICRQQPWWKSPKVLITDPQYVTQHHSMPSVGECWLKLTGLVAGGERGHILPGIERMKGFLKPNPLTQAPGIVFSPRCHGILSELGAEPHPLKGPRFGQVCVYHWKIDQDGNTVNEVPEDEYNHGIKAVTYGLVARYGWGHTEQEEGQVTYYRRSQEEKALVW